MEALGTLKDCDEYVWSYQLVWESLIFRLKNISIDKLATKESYKEKLDKSIFNLMNHLLNILP